MKPKATGSSSPASLTSPRGSMMTAKRRCSIDSTGELVDIVARAEQLATNEHALDYVIHGGIGNLSSRGCIVDFCDVSSTVPGSTDVSYYVANSCIIRTGCSRNS